METRQDYIVLVDCARAKVALERRFTGCLKSLDA